MEILEKSPFFCYFVSRECFSRTDKVLIVYVIYSDIILFFSFNKTETKTDGKERNGLGWKTNVEIPVETVWVMGRTLGCQQVALKHFDPPATIMTLIIRLKEILSWGKISDILMGF